MGPHYNRLLNTAFGLALGKTDPDAADAQRLDQQLTRTLREVFPHHTDAEHGRATRSLLDDIETMPVVRTGQGEYTRDWPQGGGR